MNYDEQLSNLNKRLDKAKGLRDQAQWKLDDLKRQEVDLVAEIEKLGLKPQDLDAEIDKLTQEIEGLFEEAQGLIPEDIQVNDE